MTIRVVSTPGHTDTNVTYVIGDGDQPPAVFTGSLPHGSVGRTDLVDAARTDVFTRAQFHSARRLAGELPDGTALYPTHGFGSFCSSGSAAGGETSTIGEEKQRNDALITDDEDAFVDTRIANRTVYRAYYAHMGALNLGGPTAPDLSSPTPLDTEALRVRIDAREWVVDLRDRTAYAASHVHGSVGIALGNPSSIYLGWLMHWGAPLSLIGAWPSGSTNSKVRQPDPPRTSADPPRPRHIRGAPSPSCPSVILDVRRDDEYAGGYIPGAAHIPLHSLLQRLDELPPGRLWCTARPDTAHRLLPACSTPPAAMSCLSTTS
jgi:rhodanese-related sulfurtransferase